MAGFISRIISFDTNSLVSEWKLSGDEDFFRDHFEGMPVLPGMMILESLVTGATWLARVDSDFVSLNFRLSDLTNYKLPSSVRPPETLNIKVEIIDRKPDVIKFKGRAEASGQTVGHGSFSLIQEEPVDKQSADFYRHRYKEQFHHLIEAQK